MANGYCHQAFESTPGNETNTPTLSTKVLFPPLRSFAPKLAPKPLERDDELRNVDEPLQVLPEAYDPEWALESRLYPDTTGFELKAMLGAPVTTAGDGIITDPDGSTIPAGATRHVWTAPYGPAGINPMTTQRQAAYKDASVFFKLKGCGTRDFAIDTPANGGAMLKAAGPALYMASISDPALTATYEALTIPPFLRSHLVIATWLGSTAESEDFTIAGTNPIEAIRTLGIASRFPDAMEKGDGPIVFRGSIPKRLIDVDDYNALVAATAFTVKARWQSTVNIGATAYKYALWFEANNAQYMDGAPEPLANKRRLGATFDWKATYGGSAGSSKWTLVNATTSYS